MRRGLACPRFLSVLRTVAIVSAGSWFVADFLTMGAGAGAFFVGVVKGRGGDVAAGRGLGADAAEAGHSEISSCRLGQVKFPF